MDIQYVNIAGTEYLPTFSESNAWDCHLVMTQGFPKMSQCLLKISDDFPRTSERCRKMSEDVLPTFEHFQIKAVEMTILVFWFVKTQSRPSFNAFLDFLVENWIEFSLLILCVQICESGVRNCPWCRCLYSPQGWDSCIMRESWKLYYWYKMEFLT